MTETPYLLQPAILIFGISAILGFVTWLIRQEGKITQALERIAKLELAAEEIRHEIIDHKDRENLHFNERVARQVEEKNDARFGRLEADIKEIKQMVRDLTKR
ncbi:MAG: hypothetical protein IPN69_08175 [Acidobacteria bacterium]|nr:hypothetical protein [Acidobacteriota bacterium]